MTTRTRLLQARLLALLGVLFLMCWGGLPCVASGGEGEKGEEVLLEATRRNEPMVTLMDVVLVEAATKDKEAGNEREVERHDEPVVTELSLALTPEAAPKGGEGAEEKEVEIARRHELLAPTPPPDDGKKAKKKEGEGEAEAPPVDVELARKPEAVISDLTALLDKIEPPKGEGEGEATEMELTRKDEPIIDQVSLAFTKSAAGTKSGGEGEGNGLVEFKRHPEAYCRTETPLEAALRKESSKGKGEGEEGGEVEGEYRRHAEGVVDDVAIAVATGEGSNKGEGEGASEAEYLRKPGTVIDEVDAALDKVKGGKGEGEGGSGEVELARKKEVVISESEIPGLEVAELPEPTPTPAPSPSVAPAPAPSPAPQHGDLFTAHGTERLSHEATLAEPRAGSREPRGKWPGRDLTTPARRLIGHWCFRLGSVQGDYWFAPLDARTGKGGLTVNDQGSLRRGSWRLIRDDVSGQSVTVSSSLLASDPFTFGIPPHGATLIEVYSANSALTLDYAGTSTAPGEEAHRRSPSMSQGKRAHHSPVAGTPSAKHDE